MAADTKADARMADNIEVIVTGTDPTSAKGGIGVVLPGYIKSLQLAGFETHVVPTYNPAVPGGKWRPWLGSFSRLRKLVSSIRKRRRTAVIYSHVGDGFSFVRESIVLAFCRFAGARTMYQFHSCNVARYIDQWPHRWLLKLAMLPAHGICVLTPWWSKQVAQTGIAANRLFTIPNPLPEDLLARAMEPYDPGKPDKAVIDVLSMSRLVPGKGVDIVIRAMADVSPQARLVIAGDGEQRGELEQLVEDLGLEERVLFKGWISGEEKAALLRSSDLFCLPSTYDAFPMSMVEAMCYGLPVIAARWGGIPDVVNDGKVGILSGDTRPESIASAINGLIEPSSRHEMGRNAKSWVREISGPDKVADKLSAVLANLTR